MNISCHLLNTEIQNCYQYLGYLPSRCGWLWTVVDCELQLTAAAQHYQKVLYCISLAQKKIKIQNLKYWISITLYYLKVKKLFKSNHHKLDTACSNISHTCLSYIYHICSIFANFPFYYKPVLILSNHTEIIFLSVSFVF